MSEEVVEGCSYQCDVEQKKGRVFFCDEKVGEGEGEELKTYLFLKRGCKRDVKVFVEKCFDVITYEGL